MKWNSHLAESNKMLSGSCWSYGTSNSCRLFLIVEQQRARKWLQLHAKSTMIHFKYFSVITTVSGVRCH
jgi:C1A family cysteine protease